MLHDMLGACNVPIYIFGGVLAFRSLLWEMGMHLVYNFLLLLCCPSVFLSICNKAGLSYAQYGNIYALLFAWDLIRTQHQAVQARYCGVFFCGDMWRCYPDEKFK